MYSVIFPVLLFVFEDSSGFQLGVKRLLKNNGWFHYTYGYYLCPNFNIIITLYGRLNIVGKGK